MKTKLLLIMLTIAILLCACTASDTPDISKDASSIASTDASSEDAVSETSSAPVDESSEVSEPADESSDISEPADESSDSADVSDDVSQENPPELIDVDYVSVDSLSNPVLQLPCHTRDNLPEDFIAAMQNNPIDIDFWAEFAETEDEEEIDALYQKYINLWQEEIDRATADLSSVLGILYEEELYNYAAIAIEAGAQKATLDYQYYLNIDEGAYIGTYFIAGLLEMQMDMFRQTAFRLKYMLYLTETADGGTADASLRFVYSPVHEGEGKELVVIAADDGFLIRTPYSPSYTGEYGTTFINAMRYNPIDQTEAPTLKAFENEITYAVEQMGSLLSDASVRKFDSFADAYMLAARFDASWFSILFDLGYIEEDICAQQEIVGYRQVLFALKYWMFVFETENGDDPNLSFTFSK